MMDEFDILFHRKLIEALEEELRPLTDEVLLGKFSTFDAYKHAAGQVAGLSSAIKIANGVRHRILNRDKVRES